MNADTDAMTSSSAAAPICDCDCNNARQIGMNSTKMPLVASDIASRSEPATSAVAAGEAISVSRSKQLLTRNAGAALDASRIALMVGMADAIMCPMPPGLLANDLSSANASSPRIGSL